jgi:cobaltochelatase CobS
MENELKYFYLTRDSKTHQYKFELCMVDEPSTTRYKRVITMLEGDSKDLKREVHPEGVAWGKLYPRLFQAYKAPEAFIFHGRVLIKNESSDPLVPKKDSNYRFQPFVSSVIDSLNGKENVLLTGGTGVGKTSCIEQLAAECNTPLIRINLNGETRLSDFIGKVHVLKGETHWVDGVLPMAMKHGYWLLLDELDFADPAILSLLHPVLEDNPCLVLKENHGEVVRPHKNFRIIATANSIGAMSDKAGNYSGTNHMNEAFLDRWQVLFIPNLTLKEELKVVKAKVSGLKSSWAKNIVDFAQKVRARKLENNVDLASDSFSTRRVLSWAKKTALLRSPIEGAKLAWLDKIQSSDHDVLMRLLELYFKTSKGQKKVKLGNELGRKVGRPKKAQVQAPAPTPTETT